MTSETSGSLQGLRRTNRQRLLSLLLSEGPLHRAELARLAGVSRTTVSTIASELIERRLVLEQEPSAGGKVDGRARELLTVNPAAGAAAGLDFTLRDIHCHVTDLSGFLMVNGGVEVAEDSTWQARVEASLALLDRMLGRVGLTRGNLIGMGVGVPGQISLSTGVVGASLPGQPWVGLNVAAEFGERLETPMFVDNNTRMEAVAEAMYGAGHGARHLFYLGLSSGIGTGMLLDGTLYRGALGGAGELGHVSVDIDGAACPCGNRGCLVQYASVPAVLAALRPTLGPDLTIDEVLARVENGDRACVGVVNDIGRLVGRVLANVCNLLNPERIVVGGELARAGDVLLGPLRIALHRYAMAATRDVDVVRAALGLGARAGALGSASLVLRETPGIAAALLRTA